MMKGFKCLCMTMQLMEHVNSSFMCLFLLWASLMLQVSGNIEVDALTALKNSLTDPNGVLQSWDSTLVTPCTWFHVTCNNENSVTRVDLGNANLSGQLVLQLGQLPNLQYLELYSNNITGKIPDELGSLTNLVSLDLYMNNITDSIPDKLANLKKLRFLRLNNNRLTGNIPMRLTTVDTLQVLDLSNNNLTGEVPVNGSFSMFTLISFKNNPHLIKTSPTPPPAAPTQQSSVVAIMEAEMADNVSDRHKGMHAGESSHVGLCFSSLSSNGSLLPNLYK